MRHEFHAPTLRKAVAKAVGRPQPALRRKALIIVDAGISGRTAIATISEYVEAGEMYEICWEALDPAVDGHVYFIDISSYDGNGSYSDTFSHSGSWSFVAERTGRAAFGIRVSFSGGNVLF